MAEPIIRVENLGKKYLLKHKAGGERYHALRDVLASGIKTGFGLFAKDRTKSPTREEFWALKDVSFEVAEGEVVGIIGRNGAGKSTLLKILSRITEPTTGRVTLNGRVASLLEVGTGFHPELTGRENIYLNGTILGMRRGEIARKFDEIVAFAEVEKFLDTPVKRYSSGMYVRLAFAVAAHLEPEILVVDEVLAVGDAAFQKKCLGKMGEVARGGRTVLFVSHNMGAVIALCQSAVWLNGGRLHRIGNCRAVVAEYGRDQTEVAAEVEVQSRHRKQGTGVARLTHVALLNEAGAGKTEFLIGEPMEVVLSYQGASGAQGTGWVIVNNADGVPVASGLMKDQSKDVSLEGVGSFRVRVEAFGLLPGTYTLSAGLLGTANEVLDWCDQLIAFDILRHYADGRSFDSRLGVISQVLPWRHQAVTSHG